MMNKIINLHLLLVLFISISCNSVDPEPEIQDPLDIQADLTEWHMDIKR